METSAATSGASVKVSRKAWIILALLTVAMAISYVDRFVLAMLIQPVKMELDLSDTEIGIVTGFAFSAFYALFGLVMARFADTRGVRKVFVGSLLVWSAMTALCGVAQNFFHMLVARFGVGAGEAGVAPAGHATLARVFPAERHSMALAVFSAGGPVGIMLALFVTGVVEAAVGWRWTFVLMGVPGVVLALVMLLAGGIFPARAESLPGDQPPENLLSAVKRLVRMPIFIGVNLLMSSVIFLGFGVGQWIPAYFERTFAVTRAELGVSLALTQGIGMLAGSVGGGLAADWLMRREKKWRNYFIVGTILIAIPLSISVYFAGNVTSASLLVGLAIFFMAMPVGAMWATVQDVAPEEHRATGSAITMMVGFVIGQGVGPFAIGLASDFLYNSYGILSLRYALIICVSSAAVLMLIPLFLLGAHTRRGGGEPQPSEL
ncbi:spinster family MFS transporter [Emcibacter nanhaiensis]|nr:MFS transporter [Emcibacter nanhaiensis]